MAARSRALPGLARRGHAAADSGRAGCAVLRALPGAISQHRRAGRRQRRGAARCLAGARVLPPRTPAQGGRGPRRRAARRALPRRLRGGARPAGRRCLYGRSRSLDRLRTAACRHRRQRGTRAGATHRRGGSTTVSGSAGAARSTRRRARAAVPAGRLDPGPHGVRGAGLYAPEARLHGLPGGPPVRGARGRSR